MATLKQSLANRLNALKATGPRSPEGRRIASLNSRKHGLSRLGLVPPPEMAGAIADRKAQWRPDYRPGGPAQEWQFERLCAESVRLDFCERRLLVARAEAAERAAESWDDDRAAEVASLAARFPDHPERIQPKLLTSRHGVLWMLERWEVVAESLRRHDGWTPENWNLAMDLLGVSPEERRESGPWDLHPEDKSAAPGLELVGQGVEALRARLESSLNARDARRREDAEAGLGGDESPEVRRLERYAADARRQVARSLAELKRLQAEAARAPVPSAARRPIPDGPPGPRPDRTALRSRTRTPADATSPAPAPSPTPTEPAPIPTPTPTVSAPMPASSLAASHPAMPGLSLRDRFLDRNAPSNRRSRRAQAALARRS